jgi:hypothetical protein
MECTAEQFFTMPINSQPFGAGPWPCLNPACSRFNELCIEHCEVKPNSNKNVLTGIFGCECGFTYTRTGFTGSSDNPRGVRHIRYIKARGHIWEAAFRNYWADPTVSIKEMRERLRIGDDCTVRNYADRLDLSFPREGPDGMVTRPAKNAGGKCKRVKVADEDFRKGYRDEWLKALEEAPDTPRYKLRLENSRVSSWLIRNDKDWFYAHQPPLQKAAHKAIASSC